jgi:hypothetical protein
MPDHRPCPVIESPGVVEPPAARARFALCEPALDHQERDIALERALGGIRQSRGWSVAKWQQLRQFPEQTNARRSTKPLFGLGVVRPMRLHAFV